jgi:hypothetical protein
VTPKATPWTGVSGPVGWMPTGGLCGGAGGRIGVAGVIGDIPAGGVIPDGGVIAGSGRLLAPGVEGPAVTGADGCS